MKKKFTAFLLLAFAAGVFTGCLTSKNQVVTPNSNGGFDTNVVTTVNEANLALDSAGLQSLTAIGASLLLQNNEGLRQPLQNADTALDGILNGTNPQTLAQVIAMLKAQNNPQLTAEITSIQAAVSQLEQDELKKWGATPAGEITVALTRAVERGLRVALTAPVVNAVSK